MKKNTVKKNNGFYSIEEYYFEEFFYRFPVKGTKRGIHRYDYRLGNFHLNSFRQWKEELLDIKKKIFALKVKKHFFRNTDLLMLERRVENEIGWINEEEFRSSPFLYISTIYDGLIYPAFGSYANLSVRGKNFMDRADDIKNIVSAAKENLQFSEATEKDFALERLNFLLGFFNEYTGYLSGKSDVGLKEEIKASRISVSNDLKELYDFVFRLPIASNNKKLSFIKKIKREYLEDYPLRGLQLDLHSKILNKAVLIERKSREIKISEPIKATIEQVLNDKKEISLDEVFDKFELIKRSGEPLFGPTKLTIDYKRILPDSERQFDSLAKLSNNIIIPPGPFDSHSTIPVMAVSPVSINNIVLRLISIGYPGRSFQSEVLKNKSVSSKKLFNNPLFNEGWELYSQLVMVDSLKKKLGLTFELTAMYNEYATLLKAFIENELLNKKVQLSEISNIVESDRIILDKNNFLYNTVAENGKSLKAVIGLNSILYFKRKFIKRGFKEKDFHLKLLSNSTLPFKFVEQAIKK